MYLLFVILAAFSYTIGGIYMKYADGLSKIVPSLLVYLLFLIGASLQTLAMQNSRLGITYIFVLGLESVLALLFGAIFFKEKYSFLKLLGVSLIVGGIVLVRT